MTRDFCGMAHPADGMALDSAGMPRAVPGMTELVMGGSRRRVGAAHPLPATRSACARKTTRTIHSRPRLRLPTTTPPSGITGLPAGTSKYMELYMKRILIELDDQVASDLERVAPARSRKRAQFIRMAVQQAIDRALDRDTAKAYASNPLPGETTGEDLVGWDPNNALARPAPKRTGRKAA